MRIGALAASIFCLLGCLLIACQSPLATTVPTPLPTSTLAPRPTPTPAPSPLTDDQALALMREALTARGVDPGTVRLAIKKDSRTVSVRYNSAYHPDSAVYRAQTLLIALAVSRVALRVEPPLEGGVQVSIIPELDDEIGLKVILIDWTSLTAWAEGMLSEEGFVAAWAVGSIPRE